MCSPVKKSSKFSAECVTTCWQKVESPKQTTLAGLMFSKKDHEFIDFLFGKLTCLTDTEMIDLQDDDTCCDHLEFEQLTSND
jgi:hypothetical protein